MGHNSTPLEREGEAPGNQVGEGDAEGVCGGDEYPVEEER